MTTTETTVATVEWATVARPAWAKAALVAEFQIDDCDTQTDYFGTRRGRLVLLGWSRSARFSFAECRALAKTHPDTAHLAAAGPDAEHRETWSMGRGMIFGADRFGTGWTIQKWDARQTQCNPVTLEVGPAVAPQEKAGAKTRDWLRRRADRITEVRAYTLDNGFSGEACYPSLADTGAGRPTWAWLLASLDTLAPSIRVEASGRVVVRYHSNHWLHVTLGA